jgi:hypothetical protein
MRVLNIYYCFGLYALEFFLLGGPVFALKELELRGSRLAWTPERGLVCSTSRRPGSLTGV